MEKDSEVFLRFQTKKSRCKQALQLWSDKETVLEAGAAVAQMTC